MLRWKKKIRQLFIIEDNELYAKAFINFAKTKFNEAEFQLKWFPAGELALQELSSKPDAVIIDYHLDGKYGDALNGMEIAKKIKETCKSTKIIFLSSQTDVSVTLEAIRLEGFVYVLKNDQAFESVIKHVLN